MFPSHYNSEWRVQTLIEIHTKSILTLNIYMHFFYDFCYRTYIYTTGVSFSIGEAAPHHVLQDCISGECAVPGRNATFCFLWFTNCVLFFDKSLILGCFWAFVFVLKNTLRLGIWCSAIPHLPGFFLTLDLLSEYGIQQHGANRPLYVTTSYSTWIFCRGVSELAAAKYLSFLRP